jgi:hypothetical protein
VSQLKTVEEHNAERVALREKNEELARHTGVACPGCGQELLWVSPLAPNHSRFAPRQARCRKCDIDVALEG